MYFGARAVLCQVRLDHTLQIAHCLLELVVGQVVVRHEANDVHVLLPLPQHLNCNGASQFDGIGVSSSPKRGERDGAYDVL